MNSESFPNPSSASGEADRKLLDSYKGFLDATAIKRYIIEKVIATGAVAVGFAEAEEVDPAVIESYRSWIAGGNHAGMEYLARHTELKSNPRHVLENVATVISIAYSYAPTEWRDDSLPVIAAYAYGDDYHDVLRAKLQPLVESFKSRFGGDWRICIDSAPLAERYWALKAGIGRRGLNGSVIVDSHGSYIFLVEILTSLQIAPDSPSEAFNTASDNHILATDNSKTLCMGCGACHKACPTGALQTDGTIDCRRCLNYLTIEHRGDWDETGQKAMHTPAGRHTLFGCDICQRVCPHNRDIPPTRIKEFHPRPGIISHSLTPNHPQSGIKSPSSAINPTQSGINQSDPKPVTAPSGLSSVDSRSVSTTTDINSDNLECSYTREEILAMTQETFSKTFKGSPIKRTKLAGLLRNASNLTSPDNIGIRNI